MKLCKKINKYALTISMVLAVSGYFMNSQIIAASETTSNLNEKTASFNKPVLQIPFEEEFNTVVIPITINGSQKLRCILDTGMPEGVFLFDPTTAKKTDLKYANTNVRLRGAGTATQTASMALGTTVGLNNIKLTEQRVIVLNNPGYLAKIGVDGAIGASVFSKYVVQMDFDKKILSLYSSENIDAKQFGEELVMKIINTKPYINAKASINGKQSIPVSLLVDTGAGTGITLKNSTSSDIALPKKVISGVLGGGVGGDIIGSLGRVSSIELGKYKLNQVIAGFSETANNSGNGVIGMGILKRFLVTFDYANNRMFLLPNKSFKDTFEFNMTGFSVKPDAEGKLEVNHIFKDSPAHKAKIQKGDKIISINDKKLSFSKYNRLKEFLKKDGEKITILYERNGKQYKATLTLRKLL